MYLDLALILGMHILHLLEHVLFLTHSAHHLLASVHCAVRIIATTSQVLKKRETRRVSIVKRDKEI